MRILYLVHRIPYPPNKGDKIRSFNEIKYLSKRHKIHLACLIDEDRDIGHIKTLEKYCSSVNAVKIDKKIAKLRSLFSLIRNRPLSVSYFFSKNLKRRIDQLLETQSFDAILVFSSSMAQYVINVKGIPKIMDFVDVDSDKWLQYSKYTRFPYSWLYQIEANRLAKYETNVAETFDHSIFVSEKEVELFKKQNPQIRNVTAISNGVDLEYFNPELNHSSQFIVRNNENNQQQSTCIQKPILLFSGAMDYYANVDGVIWFCKDIFPGIKERFPTAQFYIVGSKPNKKIQRLMKNDGVVVTGFVEDIRQYYRKADLCVIPLRIARGIQNKILEAMAFDIPVVATPQAFAGIKALPERDLEIAEDSKEFITKSIHVLSNQKFKEFLTKNGKKVVRNYYNWATNLSYLESILLKKNPQSF